jgi:hypothetical protein
MMSAYVARHIHGWVLGLVGLRRTGYIYVSLAIHSSEFSTAVHSFGLHFPLYHGITA